VQIRFAKRVLVIVALTSVMCISRVGRAQEHGLGLILAKPEQLRGIPLADLPFSGATLPKSADLSDKMPPVGNQGKQSSCVAWTVAYALKSYQERDEEKWEIMERSGQLNQDHVFSPAFIYNQINTNWTCWIPYPALNLGIGWVQTPVGPRYVRGQAQLLAEPVLYVNSFGLQAATPLPFTVTYP
jgi:hypothetical protein